jgi:hypothetical protein
VIVDEQGRFRIRVACWFIQISATRASYLDGSYGNLRPDGNGRALDLQDGERVIDAVVRLWRSATIMASLSMKRRAHVGQNRAASQTYCRCGMAPS